MRGMIMAMLMVLGCSAAVQKWPATTPPDKSDPSWEFNNNLNVNGVPYLKVEVSPGKWEWRESEAQIKAYREREKERADLYAALRTRVLTNKEWEAVIAYGHRLNIVMILGISESYNEGEKAKELNEAYLQQFRLMLTAQQPPSVR